MQFWACSRSAQSPTIRTPKLQPLHADVIARRTNNTSPTGHVRRQLSGSHRRRFARPHPKHSTTGASCYKLYCPSDIEMIDLLCFGAETILFFFFLMIGPPPTSPLFPPPPLFR